MSVFYFIHLLKTPYLCFSTSNSVNVGSKAIIEITHLNLFFISGHSRRTQRGWRSFFSWWSWHSWCRRRLRCPSRCSGRHSVSEIYRYSKLVKSVLIIKNTFIDYIKLRIKMLKINRHSKKFLLLLARNSYCNLCNSSGKIYYQMPGNKPKHHCKKFLL